MLKSFLQRQNIRVHKYEGERASTAVLFRLQQPEKRKERPGSQGASGKSLEGFRRRRGVAQGGWRQCRPVTLQRWMILETFRNLAVL